MSAPVTILPRLDPARARATMVAPEGANIAQIVDLALPGLPARRRGWVRVTVGDRLVPAERWAQVRPKPHAPVVVRLVAAGEGSLRTILMIAVTVAAMAVGQFWVGPALAGTFGLSAGTWAAIGTAATMVAGTLLVNALVPQRRKESDDKARYAISGQQNAIAPDAPLPITLGDMRMAPPFAALPWTEDVSDHEQYFYGLYVVGVGAHEIADLRIGDTPIERYADVIVETRAGLPADPPLTLISSQVYEDATQTQLSNADGPVTRISGGDAAAISVTLRWPGGLIVVDNKGKRKSANVQVRVRARLAGASTWTDIVTLDVWRKTTRDFRLAHVWDTPARGRYEIEITRLTVDTDDSDTHQTTCHLVAIRTFRPEYPLNLPADRPLALIALRMRGSRQLQGMVDTLTARVRPLIPDWDAASGTWLVRASSNPASLARWLLQGPMNAFPMPDARIDLARLADWHAHCAAQGLTYNGVITDETKLRDALADVCAAGRARPLDRGGLWSVVIDRAAPTITAAITPRNARDIGWTPHYTRTPDAVRVPFLDASNDHKRTERVVPWIGFSGAPDVVEEWEFPGVTDPAQIWRAARRRMRELRDRPHPYTAVQDVEHLCVEPGDRVLLSHPYLIEQAVVARVVDVVGPTLHLDAPVVMASAATYRARLRGGDGALRVADIVTAPGETRAITLAAPLVPPPAPGDLAMFGRYGEEAVDCLVSRIEPGDDWSATLVLLPHAPDLDAETAADTPPPWDGRAGGVVTSLLTPGAPRIVQTFSGYEIAAEPEGTIQIVLAPATGESVPVARYDLRHRLAGATTWTETTNVAAQASLVYAPEDEIELQARAAAYNGARGAWSATVEYTVLPMDAPGPVISTYAVSRLANGLWRSAWTFAAPPGGELIEQYGVEIRWKAGSSTDWAALDPLHSGYLFASPYEHATPALDGQFTFAARARDLAGAIGAPKFVTVSTTPTAPVAISGARVGDDIRISVTMSVAQDAGGLRIWRSLASASVSTETDVSGLLTAPAGTTVNWTNTGAAASGQPNYRYRARAVNGAGVTSAPTAEVLP